MHITELRATNIMRLEAVEIKPDGNMIEITGPNEAGKSTVLNLFVMAMGGKSAQPVQPLRKGAKKGKIELALGKYKIKWTYTEASGGVLKVESADGASYKSPQALIDGWKCDFTFHPNEFAEASPGPQREMLLKVIDIHIDRELVGKTTGIGIPPNKIDDPLGCIEEVRKIIYTNRQDVGRDLTRVKKVHESIVIPEGEEGTQPVNVTKLANDKSILVEVEYKNASERELLTSLDGDIEEYRGIYKDKKNRVATIERQITALQKDLKSAKEGLTKTTEKALKLKDEKKKQATLVEALIDPDFTDIDQQIDDADETNKKAQKVIDKKEAEKDVETHQTKYNKYSKKLTWLKDYRDGLLDKAEMPVKGLGINEEGIVTFEDIPVSQRGKSQRILIGLEVCRAMKPKLKVVLIHDGNDFDNSNVQVITKWAEENDFQVWREVLKASGKGVSFEIIDGKI